LTARAYLQLCGHDREGLLENPDPTSSTAEQDYILLHGRMKLLSYTPLHYLTMMSVPLTRARSVFLALIVLGCSNTTSPPSGITLLVTNATCTADQCSPVQVLGFPENQPRTPGGMWSIDFGVVSGSSGCLTVPTSANFRVVDGSTGAATTYTWTTLDRISLGTLNGQSRIQAYPTTNTIVPGKARGWSVTLPAGVSVSPAQSCSPQTQR
jgi:hypothetical protein